MNEKEKGRDNTGIRMAVALRRASGTSPSAVVYDDAEVTRRSSTIQTQQKKA
jgi:hypothetical protein